MNDSFSCVRVFAVTLTTLCVHQGRDLLSARLTQPFGVPGWVEVHQPLSAENRGDGKREHAGEIVPTMGRPCTRGCRFIPLLHICTHTHTRIQILTSKQDSTHVRASCLSLSLITFHRYVYEAPSPPPPLAARSTLSPIEDRLVDPVGGDIGGRREGGRSVGGR